MTETKNAMKGRKGFASVPLAQRFWQKVEIRGEDECWAWTGANDGRGYGQIWCDGRNRRATQVAWELAQRVSFPEGKDACHTCDNPTCVNPAHIWAGSKSQNTRDSVAKGRWRTGRKKNPVRHCKNGHPYDEENTTYLKRGGRLCRSCQRIWKARHASKALQSKDTPSHGG